MRVVSDAPGRFARLEEIILATARTERLAGSAEAGMATYVTRSKVFGFPDYTTIRQRDGQLEIYGRLRFGKSDLGVNKARVESWLAHLDHASGVQSGQAGQPGAGEAGA